MRRASSSDIMSTPSDQPKEGVEQIREILVGAFQREFERRLARVESHFATRSNDLQQDARRRMEVIESHLKKETDTLAARFEADTVEARDALRASGREYRETMTALDMRVAKLEEAVSKQQQALRQQILDQAKSFLDEMHALRAEFAETLERELGPMIELGEEPEGREAREVSERSSH
jgi:hypothetical protein